MTEPNRAEPPRETYTSRISLVLTMLGVAVGLGNVWRFPYMVGKFGGAAFVLVYVLISAGIGVAPAHGGVRARARDAARAGGRLHRRRTPRRQGGGVVLLRRRRRGDRLLHGGHRL